MESGNRGEDCTLSRGPLGLSTFWERDRATMESGFEPTGTVARREGLGLGYKKNQV